MYQLIKPVLFTLDPELIHDLTLNILSKIGSLLKRSSVNDEAELACEIAGINFPNRIGLAAGMDKACLAPLAWQGLGFGFIEIGTVTNVAQAGNEKPRLFRIKEKNSLLNCLGFNNLGAEKVAEKLKLLRENTQFKIPIGINIGKSRIIDPRNPEEVIKDYLASLELLENYADYITINVSSPNTPGLREWESPNQLKKLLEPIIQKTIKPVFLKISPDMEDENLYQVLEISENLKIKGLVATNTTTERQNTPLWANSQMGGISGELLKARSLRITKLIGKNKSKNLALISVGGISSLEDIKIRLDSGADLIQIYTALVYEGPFLINKINENLLDKTKIAKTDL